MRNDLIYGLHAVRTLLDQKPVNVLEIWILDTRHDKPVRSIRGKARTYGIHIERSSRKTLDRLTDAAAHQGVVARCRSTRGGPVADIESLLARVDDTTLLLMLDGLTDPHNLGACLRNADAAAVSAIITPRSRGVGLTPAARKVASGAADSVPLITVANLARAIEIVQDTGVTVIGTADDATENIYDVDLRGPLAFVLGAEERGLRHLTRKRCDRLVRIPMLGVLSSLNVASACAVLVYEARRQQRPAGCVA